jgi:hypothetical protein
MNLGIVAKNVTAWSRRQMSIRRARFILVRNQDVDESERVYLP